MKITDAIQEIRETLGFNEGSPYDVKIGYDDAKRISSLLDVIHNATLVEIKASDLRNICIATQDKDIEKFRKFLYALSVVAKGSFNSKLSNDELVKEVESSINSIVVAAGLVEKDVGAGDRIEKLRGALFRVLGCMGDPRECDDYCTDVELINNVGRSINYASEQEQELRTSNRACINGLLDYLQPGIHRGPDDPDYIAELENAMELLTPEDKHPWVEIIIAAGKEGGTKRVGRPKKKEKKE